MNATAERATRREIRRAFGDQAVANLHALDTRITGLETAHDAVVTLSRTEWKRLDEKTRIAEGACEVNDRHIKDTYAAFVAHRDMSFLQRLRWLLFGWRP